jgi:hypothetical protein
MEMCPLTNMPVENNNVPTEQPSDMPPPDLMQEACKPKK